MEKPESHRKYSTLRFWLGVVFLNTLLFLPAFLFNFSYTHFLPTTSLDDIWLFSARDNPDLFRLSGEWCLLLAVIFLIRKKEKIFKWALYLVGIIYLFLFLYNVYYAFSISLYGQHPSFINDIALAQETLPIFLGQITANNQLLYAMSALGVLIVSFLVFRAVIKTGKRIPQLKANKTLAGAAGVLGIWLMLFTTLGVESRRPGHEHTAFWTSPLVAESITLGKKNTFHSPPELNVYADYLKQELVEKPDVWLIFIESYGEILKINPKLTPAYDQLMHDMQQKLDTTDWHVSSSLSGSPIKGGRSWLAFTAAMIGMQIDDQLEYNGYLDYYGSGKYPHMINFFNKQNYNTYRIKSTSDVESAVKVDGGREAAFYGFDKWIKFGNIPYKGFKYDWFGGIPDQYTLNYAWEKEMDQTQPSFTFWITMNSHTPWFPVAPLRDDWQSLDTIRQAPYDTKGNIIKPWEWQNMLFDPLEERYSTAIRYQLEMVTDFILKYEKPAIFIVLGDHQPSMVNQYGELRHYTPMHIISQDQQFVKSLDEYAFKEGMKTYLDQSDKPWHGGLYSLLARHLLMHYGKKGSRIPEYRRKGLGKR